MYSIDSDPGGVVRETVPVVALICICRLVGAEQPHFWSSLAMAMLICGSSLAELGRGIGVARVAYMRLLAMVMVFGRAAGGGGGERCH